MLPISFEWTLPRKNESLDEYLSRSNRIAINRREQSLSTKTSSVGIKRNKQTPIRSRSESYAMRQLSIGTGHYHKLLHRPTTIAPINNSTSIFASNDENDVMVSFKERTPSQVRVKLYDDDVDIQRLYGDADGDARVRHCCRRYVYARSTSFGSTSIVLAIRQNRQLSAIIGLVGCRLNGVKSWLHWNCSVMVGCDPMNDYLFIFRGRNSG